MKKPDRSFLIGTLTGMLMIIASAQSHYAFAGDAVLSWNPDMDPTLAGYKVYYGTASGHYGIPVDVGIQTTYMVTGLGFGTYYFTVTAYDSSGIESSYSNEVSKTFIDTSPPPSPTPPDTTPPQISAVSAGSITGTSAVIAWSTDETATSQVAYGTTTAYGSATAYSPSLVTSHAQTLAGLQPGQSYHYQVKSEDSAGNLSVSGDLVFTTTSPPDTTPPANARNFTAQSEGQQITLSWTNPPDSDFVGVRIRYRTDRFPSEINDGDLLGDFTGQPDQAMSTTQTSLQSGATYYYSASTYDSSGNYQQTVYASATAASEGANTSVGGSGGCGMVFPTNGKPPGPAQAADMAALFIFVLIGLIRRKIKELTVHSLFSLNHTLTVLISSSILENIENLMQVGDNKRANRATRLEPVLTHLFLIGIFTLSISGCGDSSASGPDVQTESSVGSGPGKATLSWDKPTINADGSSVSDLAGFKLYYGTTLPLTPYNGQAIKVEGTTVYTLDGFDPGTYYFAVTALDENGNESPFSNEVSKVIAGTS